MVMSMSWFVSPVMGGICPGASYLRGNSATAISCGIDVANYGKCVSAVMSTWRYGKYGS